MSGACSMINVRYLTAYLNFNLNQSYQPQTRPMTMTDTTTPLPNELTLDADGHLTDHTLWTPVIAQHLADTLNVQLTDVHYRILAQVRGIF